MAARRRRRWVVGARFRTRGDCRGVGASSRRDAATAASGAVRRRPLETATSTNHARPRATRSPARSAIKAAYTVAAAASGVLTAAPPVGSVITRGHPLFSVNNTTSYLLYGPIPAWRDYTTWSTHGPGHRELSANLVAMGYLPASGRSDHAGWGITNAVERWQAISACR